MDLMDTFVDLSVLIDVAGSGIPGDANLHKTDTEQTSSAVWIQTRHPVQIQSRHPVQCGLHWAARQCERVDVRRRVRWDIVGAAVRG